MISVLAGQVAAKYIKAKNESVTCSSAKHKYCKYVGSVDERLAAYDMARFLLSHGSTPEGALASMLAHS